MKTNHHHRQGIVLEDIDSSVSSEEFKRRILKHCTTPDGPATVLHPTTHTASTDDAQTIPPPVQRSLEPTDNTAQAPPPEPVQSAAATTSQPRNTIPQNAIPQQETASAARHREQVAANEAKKASADRSKIVAGKQKEQSSVVPPARQDWLNQQQTRQQAARAEKERIKKNIELDKLARQERERARKMAARGLNDSVADAPDTFSPQRSDTTKTRTSSTCNLQVRLFDGSSVKSRFDSTSTLAGAVRAYVDSQSNSEIPYNFREMRTPLPSRTIEISEETQTLQSLGLTPSATLVLVPVSGYTDAYASSGPSGLLSKGLNTGYGLVSGAFGLVGGFLGYGNDSARDGPYMSGVGDEMESSNVEGSQQAPSSSTSGNIKIRTLADQRKQDDNRELYNGNQVSAETWRHDGEVC